MPSKPEPKKIELVERQTVEISRIDPNPWNPNMQDEEIFRVLAESVKEEGFGEPILVRPLEGSNKLQIINGEHRYRLAKEMGLSQVPVAVVDMNEISAKLATLRRNRTRGGLDTIKTAALLGAMRKRLSDEEIQQRLGYSTAELDDMLALLEMPKPAFGGRKIGPEEMLEFQATQAQAAWLDESLVKLSGRRQGRFEGKQSRKARGMQVVVQVLRPEIQDELAEPDYDALV